MDTKKQTETRDESKLVSLNGMSNMADDEKSRSLFVIVLICRAAAPLERSSPPQSAARRATK